MDGFFRDLKVQRWDDHRYYHHSVPCALFWRSHPATCPPSQCYARLKRPGGPLNLEETHK